MSLMANLRQDLRQGARAIGKAPGFAAIVVMMLALGIGVNTTVFCWLDTIVLNPLPGARDSDRLVSLVPSYRGDPLPSGLTYPEFSDLATLDEAFSGLVGSSDGPALWTRSGASEWVSGRLVTANAFQVLGVRAERGRLFVPEEDLGEGAHPVIVVSHGFWERRLGHDAAVIGTTLELNQRHFTIVGVTPPELRGLSAGRPVDFWAPLAMHNEILNYGSYESRTFRWVQALARLRPGVSLEAARAATTVLSRRVAASYPASNRDVGFDVYPLASSPVGGQADFKPLLRILMTLGIGILSIVSVNVANLLLVRAAGREKEVAIRVALGASRGRLLRQLLVESVLLTGAGALAGSLLATWAVRLFPWFLRQTNLPFDYAFRWSPRILGFTLLLSSLASLLFGLVPALMVNRARLWESLKEGGRRLDGGLRHHRIRSALVVCEVAVALPLLIGADLCLKGFQRARQVDLGFDPRNVLTAGLNLVPNAYTVERGKLFDRQLREHLQALPGVTDVGLASALPLGQRSVSSTTVDVDGYAPPSSADRLVSFTIVSPGYFSAMRIPLLEGRDFSAADDATRSNVAVVDETMASRFWPGLDAVGRRFRMAAGIAASDTFTVIGVVKAGKYRNLLEPPTPFLYLHYEQRPIASLFMGVVIRGRGHPGGLVSALRQEVHRLDGSVEPFNAQPMEEYVRPAFAQVRIAASLLMALGLSALALASLGLYGVVAYLVSRRTHEIGVRMALGAGRMHILRMVIGEGMRLIGTGGALGLVAAAGATRMLASFLYGVSPTDAATFIGAPLLFAMVSLIACCFPARRATRVDPLVALRYE